MSYEKCFMFNGDNRGMRVPSLPLLWKHGDISGSEYRLLRPTPSRQPSDPLELLVPLCHFRCETQAAPSHPPNMRRRSSEK